MSNPMSSLIKWFKLETRLIDEQRKRLYTSHGRGSRRNAPYYKDEQYTFLLG